LFFPVQPIIDHVAVTVLAKERYARPEEEEHSGEESDDEKQKEDKQEEPVLTHGSNVNELIHG